MLIQKNSFVFSQLPEYLKNYILYLSVLAYPRECCGFVLQCGLSQQYIVLPVENQSKRLIDYNMSKQAVEQLMLPLIRSREYRVLGLYHSHTQYTGEVTMSVEDEYYALIPQNYPYCTPLAYIIIGQKFGYQASEIKTYHFNTDEESFVEKEHVR